MLVVFLFMAALMPTEGLKCIVCTFSPGISGNKDGCNLQDTMETYLTDCANQTISTNNETTKLKQGNDTQNTEVILEKDLVGKLYCFTFTSQLNGKWVAERGCGSSKVPENLHGTCENVTDKNSSALLLTNAQICYCNDLDGCNKEIFIRNISAELVNSSQNSNLSSYVDGKNVDEDNSHSKTKLNKARTFSSLINQSRIQIMSNYENPFNKLRRKNNTDKVKEQITISLSPTANASIDESTSTNNDPVIANDNFNTQPNSFMNGSSDIITHNGTSKIKDNPVYNNQTILVPENVIHKSETATVIASIFTYNTSKSVSVNNNTRFETPSAKIPTTTSNNETEKFPVDKIGETNPIEISGVDLLRPYFTRGEVFTFVSVITVAFSL